ncbi:helix-turn-helix transcriptional regulator [Sphingomonas sp.]|jgi:DNA-binding CsgD family transcriptional regulator|uniref:helix-turn-helix domain-containing protein n=1 Tax=Sphingomonas sp. TaxID=28214 RepID=UPI002E343F24|nr:helix-turn-helix transcriptional regulator [Sphingomonas sp.]HEX4693583.1 helix-turn-helix transcriptional regulator [Sphingomonas sp.]
MNISPCDSLTERERTCLRLVTPGFQEKLLADQLGISHHTVKVHLRSARSKLHVSSSLTAADLLARHEGREPPSGSNTPSGMGAWAAIDVDNGTPFPLPVGGSESVVQEEHSAETVTPYREPESALQQSKGPYNAVSTLQRLTLLAFAILFLALAIVAAPAIYGSFQQVANRISPAEP